MLIPPDKKSETDTPSQPVSRPSDSSQPLSSSQYSSQYDTFPSSSHSHTSSSNQYGTADTAPLLPPPYAANTNNSPGSPPHGSPRGGKPKPRPFRRLLKALGWAGLLLIVAAVIGGLIGWLSNGGGDRHGGIGDGGSGGDGGGGVGDGNRGSKDSGGKLKKLPQNERGSWNDSWSPNTPIFSNETSPRACDTFTTPSLLPEHGTFSRLPYYHIISTHVLPLSARRIYFHGRGSHLNGHVETSVGKLDRVKGQEGVVVQVEVIYARDRSLDGWHVCRVGDEKDAGVVIVTPNHSWEEWRYEDLTFYVHIDYPSTSHLSSIGQLEVITSNMGVSFDGLQQNYNFSAVDVHTSNGKIFIDGLESGKLDLSTTNGGISAGTLRTRGIPRLSTSNGAIECGDCCASKVSDRVRRWDISTSNGRVDGRFCAKESIAIKTSSGAITGDFEAPKVGLRSSNGRIQGKVSGIQEGGVDVATSSGAISLVVDFPEQGKGLVNIPMTMTTSNGLLDVSISNLPTNVVLDAKLQTSNSRLLFRGHPHFQGDFSFSTSSFESVVFDTLEPLDGEERREVSSWKVERPPWGKSQSKISGSVAKKGVKKGDKGVAWGRIVGDTSNGSMKVYV